MDLCYLMQETQPTLLHNNKIAVTVNNALQNYSKCELAVVA